MEDTKKTVLAGNGEKDVPRAVYDGVFDNRCSDSRISAGDLEKLEIKNVNIFKIIRDKRKNKRWQRSES